jgi:hypothetical protein
VRPRSLVVLLALVLAVGAFVWFYERELPGSEERAERSRKALPGLTAGEVTAVAIEHGGETVRLARVAAPAAPGSGEGAGEGPGEVGGEEPVGGGAWQLTAPAALAGARADAMAVEGLLDALAALEKTRTLDDYDAAALGLDEPRARVVLERRGAEPLRLAVGAEVPASTAMVLAREDPGAAWVVERAIFQDLVRPAGEWRSREMVPVGREEIERVTLRGAGAAVALERDGEGFRLAAPFADAADAGAVEALLADLTGLEAQRFLDRPDRPLAELGLAPAWGVLTVATGAEGEPLRIEVGAPADEGAGHHLRIGGQVFVAETGLAEALRRPAGEWQSKALLPFELYRIDALAARGEGDPVRLARDGTDWRRGDAIIAYTPVSDLLYSVVEARAEEVVPRASLALGPSQLTLEITADAEAEGGPRRATVALHPSREGRVPATVAGRPFVLLLPAAAADAIRANLAGVREAAPVVEPGEEVPEGIAVEREEGG